MQPAASQQAWSTRQQGLLIFSYIVVGLAVGWSAYYSYPNASLQYAARAGLPLLLGISAWACHRIPLLNAFWRIPWGLFAVSLGLLGALLIADAPLWLFGLTTNTLPGFAITKFCEALPIVAAILLMTRLSGDRLDSLYIHRGRFGLGLLVGLFGFTAFATVAGIQAQQSGVALTTITDGLPFILLFVFSNSMMEELWFRGLFLGRLEAFVGRWWSLLATTVVFALFHAVVAYLSGAELILFLIIIFPLGMLWGYIIQKTDSLLGSVFFHAGADLMVVVGFMAEMGTSATSNG